MKRDAVVLSSSSWSSRALLSSAAVHHHEILHSHEKHELLTFLVDKLDVPSNKLDHSISLRRTFLDRQHADQHLQNHLFKNTLSNELDSIASPDGLSVLGGLRLKLVERNKVFLMVRNGDLSLIKDFGDSRG